MDSFISKLKSTVSEVLPGNPLSGDYDIQEKAIGSAGPGLAWNMYRANRKTTKQAASVFVFNKKLIDKLPKDDKKLIIASLKKGVQQLTKLRHPKILSVVHPIEENRDCLAFATEPVRLSLANVLEASSDEQTTKLSEVEIKYGLIQLLEAVSFLHHDVKLVHGCIHPSSIIFNDKSIWKLSGFDFFTPNASTGNEGPQFVCNEWYSGAPRYTQPHLDYLAPECGGKGYCDTKSDIYSLGVTVYAIYNQGKPIYQCHDSLSSFKQLTSEMRSFRSSLLRNIPTGLHEAFKTMVSLSSESRPDAKTLLKLRHFEDTLVMTVVYLDTLVQRDNLAKSQYYKNLPNVLKQLPLSICLHRILPTLFSECSNRDMIPFVLQNILIIAETCSKQEYGVHIFPKLVPLFKYSKPIQIPLLLLKNMPTLLSQTSDNDTKIHILPMLFTCIELDNAQLQCQELCLDILPEFSRLIDKHAMKTSVIPRIRKLCISTQYLNLRVKCLMSIAKMVTHMDKWFVLDEVLPFLPHIPSKEPAVLMAILGIYKIVFTNENLGIPKEQLATKALPFLLPLSVDHSLSKQQFLSYIAVIKQMMSRVESDHLAKLEESENQKKQDSELKFNGEQATANSLDKSMTEFLGEAGLLGTAATKPKVAPAAPMTMSSRRTTNIPFSKSTPVQVKDLTATLGSSSIQPIRQPSSIASMPPIRPLSQVSRLQTASGLGDNLTTSPPHSASLSLTPQYPKFRGMGPPNSLSTSSNAMTSHTQPISKMSGGIAQPYQLTPPAGNQPIAWGVQSSASQMTDWSFNTPTAGHSNTFGVSGFTNNHLHVTNNNMSANLLGQHTQANQSSRGLSQDDIKDLLS